MRKPTPPPPDSVHRQHPDLWARLTERETQILSLFLHHPNDKEIASQLKVSQSTIRTHLTTIERKAGVGSRNELLALFIPQEGNESPSSTR
jgi:DNA-binding CsgD family transcriptional regulator